MLPMHYDDAAHAFHSGIAQGPTIYKPYSQFSSVQSVAHYDDAAHVLHAEIAQGPTIYKPYSQFSSVQFSSVQFSSVNRSIETMGARIG